jgi:arylsulfatase
VVRQGPQHAAFAASQVGPFDQWPTGMGFEYFYGFVGGDANQWQPNLFRNTTQIYPFEGKPGWNLVTGWRTTPSTT